MDPQGIVFDFDGPIFDGRRAAATALAETLEEMEPVVGRPGFTVAGVPLYRPENLVALVYAELGLAPDRLAQISDCYLRRLGVAEARIGVEPAVRAALERLHGESIRLAVLSSRPTAELASLIARLDLGALFDVIAGRDKFAYAKPDPRALLAVAEAMGVKAADLVMVGDSDSDHAAAAGAHVPYVHAAWTGEPSGRAIVAASTVLRDHGDLAELVGPAAAMPLANAAYLDPKLVEAIGARSLIFYAGAGVSVPSGLGGWESHYLPLVRELGGGLIAEDHDLPETLQLLATDDARAQDIFDRFHDSFGRAVDPNGYHMAMLRADAQRIWTSNYDLLFEAAITRGRFGRKVVATDEALKQNFRDRKLVIKMNGDFQSARFRKDLDWDLVFLQQQFDVADQTRREIWSLFEDDFRNNCIVFVGVSFKDPMLRRIIATVRRRVPRTRWIHYLLMRRPRDRAEAASFALHADNLRRFEIETRCFAEFADIERHVAQIAFRAQRPIVGFAGNARDADPAAEPGAARVIADLDELCRRLGGSLAGRGLRVSSGHGRHVGIPAVGAAFERNPLLARFYLRRSGSSRYDRSAPAIIVPGDDFKAMRERFISELSALVAIGGADVGKETTPGAIVEVELAMARKVPVFLVPQAGGDVADYRERFLQGIDRAYEDRPLADALREANARLWRMTNAELMDFVTDGMASMIEDVICTAMTSVTALSRAPTVDW